ncbi:phospholipase D1-like isoform X2 [Portunus trituberculatus]|uniref:phospholipase D1-like isoform X2 n=1 Tax=Portunus trituberculatus TaxID=210409 RepID=UPI001E1D21CE|nr:phospholipase D1-like isoform X2 [Portunus trituberculatus]
MYRSSVTLASSGYLKEFRRKISKGDAKQEMTPLASHEEVAGTTPDYGGTAETPNSGDAGTDANAASEPVVEKQEETEAEATDVPDAKANGRNRPLRPTLKILASAQSPTLASPDSDSDVLGFLDYTPEALSDACDGRGSNAYSTVYQATKYTELMPGAFIPSLPIHLRIARVQPVHSHIHIFNNHVLVIELEHGDHRWSVERKVRQVATLHSKLLLLRTRLRMPAASRITRQRRQSMRQQIKAADQEVEDTVDSSITTNTNTAKTASTVNTNSAASPNNKRLLKFPRRALQTMDEAMRVELETYLRNLLHHTLFRSHKDVLEFFEISPVSFIGELGMKLREGYVKKRVGGSGPCECCSWLTATCTGKYRQQWLVLKETYLFFVVPETGLVRSVMLMDSAFQVSHSYRLIGARNSLLISNLSRSLLIKCDSETSKKEWLSIITKTERKYAKDFTSQDNRYGSFAPVRKNSYARWYVDGARYMWDVAELMEGAREEIFITDWWMSPQIYLKRPDLTGHKWRLAEVLRRKAESGVRVFILLYKEVELALGISSLLTKQTVNQLHPNIKVLRHPDHIAGGTLYWAHHEKVVVVDQMFAFVSGIDLAFGRWDDYRHKLIDTGHAGVQVMHPPSRPSQHSPGQMGMNRGALQHLLRGTNDVLVSTVTGSAAGSRRASLGTTEDSSAAPGSLKNVSPSPSDSEDPVSTLEVPVGPTVPSEDSQGTLRTLRSVRDSLCLASANPVEPSAGPLASPEDFSADVESQDELDEVQQPSSITNGRKMKGNRSRGKADMNSIHTSTSFQNGSTPHPSQEGKDTNTTSLPPVKRTRFFSKSGRDRANTGSSTEEERKGGGGKSFREVKRRGMDLVEEMKVKGREMKRKLHSFSRFHGRRLWGGAKERMGSCSSLAQAHSVVTMEDTTSTHLWVGKDYVNWISKDLDNLDEPFKDIVDRHQTPRMPWHDIGLFVEGAAARDVARHFIQRWNAVKTEKAKPNHSYPYLLPRTYSKESFLSSNLRPRHRVKCQVVRSVGKWSAGVDEVEASIFSAYVDLIRRAKHYIYIENQFFITSSNVDEQKEVSNYIGYEIVQRIVEAHRKGEAFRVYILMPLLPAFEGMIGKASGVAMQYIVYWNYVSICKGKSSVLHCLKEHGITDWERYVSFCSLRNHECLGERPVSELVYIHSKLMIVDDRFVIAGSANINDRSLSGMRDSEVCMVIEDQEFEEGVMNGKPYDSGIFAGSMRRYLFSEHLGEADLDHPTMDVSDPVSDAFFTNVWNYVANKNTLIYEEVFSCYPCNSATTFNDLEQLRTTPTLAEVNPADAKAKLKEVQGHLVLFPLEFLKDEMLKPGVGNKEYLLPMETWT